MPQWYKWQDSNLRPPDPKSGVLANWTTPVYKCGNPVFYLLSAHRPDQQDTRHLILEIRSTIWAIYKRLVKSDLNRWHKLVVYIIADCNYTCEYCYNTKPRSYVKLNLDKLLVFIKKLHILSKRNIQLELIGGETILHH